MVRMILKGFYLSGFEKGLVLCIHLLWNQLIGTQLVNSLAMNTYEPQRSFTSQLFSFLLLYC